MFPLANIDLKPLGGKVARGRVAAEKQQVKGLNIHFLCYFSAENHPLLLLLLPGKKRVSFTV